MIQIVVQALFFAQSFNFRRLEKPVELLEQRLPVDLSRDLFPEVDVVRTWLNLNRLEQGVNVLSQARWGSTRRCRVAVKL